MEFANFYYVPEDDKIISKHDVYLGFLDYCEDSDNVEELEESTREYNIKTGNDVSLFEMFLLWELSSCNLVEVENNEK